MTALAAVALGIVGALAGVVGPRVIAQLPEPAERSDDKVLYEDIAAAPRLGLWLAMAGCVLGAITGAAIGWSSSLWPWAYLIPLGVVLSYIDLRTRLLPTRLIAPSYLVLMALVGIAALVDGRTDVLIRAGIGWIAVGGLYLMLWLIAPRGVGYGDVRFSGLLGLALGCVGWPAIVVGAWFGFLLGGLSGLALRPFTGLKMNA
ncbi:MAG TPA: A24 family peptidase, partial [Marmoricola sp.]|nr:A24 family peptidase [Marmoricola sp.]